MPYIKQQLDAVYRQSSGYCHLCHNKLSRKNHGVHGARGVWHIDHSKPRSRGGTDHLNNLRAARIKCNVDTNDKTTSTTRKRTTKTHAPLSPEKRRQVKSENALMGAVGGGMVGFVVAGPIGAAIGAFEGGCLAGSKSPDR